MIDRLHLTYEELKLENGFSLLIIFLQFTSYL